MFLDDQQKDFLSQEYGIKFVGLRQSHQFSVSIAPQNWWPVLTVKCASEA